MAANSLFTLEQIATEVSQNYGDTSDITIAKAEKWVNRALMRVNEMGDWSWLMKFDGTFNTCVSDSGSATLVAATSSKVITLTTTQATALYNPTFFIKSPTISGAVAITGTITAQTTTTFTVTFSAAIPSTGTYSLTWSIGESYILEAGVKKIYAIYYQDNVRRKLRLIDDRRFREIFAYNTTPTGTPVWYRLAGRDVSTGRRKVSLYPIPATAMAVYYDYRQEMPMLVNSTDDVRVVCGMPDHMVDALIELATAIGFREQDDSDYEAAMVEAIARWKALLDDDLTEIDDRVRMASFDGDGTYLGDPVLPPQYGDMG